MYALLRPLLFKLDAEQAHHFTLNGLARAYRLGLLQKVTHHTCPVTLMGLSLPNPVGLAGGLDKNGQYLDALAALGFGFIEIGTVTPKAQAGNPKPRLFRVPEHQAVINRMGFNNDGIDAMIQNIEQSRFNGILGINIGKNATTPIENAADDYLICLEKAYAHASYITVNISSPNTQNLRALQGGDELSALLSTLKNKQVHLAAAHGRYVPLAVKIAPDLNEQQVADIAHAARQTEIDAIIATNTTIDKSALGHHPLAAPVCRRRHPLRRHQPQALPHRSRAALPGDSAGLPAQLVPLLRRHQRHDPHQARRLQRQGGGAGPVAPKPPVR